MPYEERTYKLIKGLEKQKATHLKNMQAHKNRLSSQSKAQKHV